MAVLIQLFACFTVIVGILTYYTVKPVVEAKRKAKAQAE